MIVRQQAYHDHRRYHMSHNIGMIIVMVQLRKACLDFRPSTFAHKQKYLSRTLQSTVCKSSISLEIVQSQSTAKWEVGDALQAACDADDQLHCAANPVCHHTTTGALSSIQCQLT